MKTFINTALVYLTNVKHVAECKRRRTGTSTQSKDSRNTEGGTGNKWYRRIQASSSRLKRHRINISPSNQLQVEGRTIQASACSNRGKKRTQEQEVISLKKRITLSLFYLDLADSCPSYALYMLKELWQK